MRLKPLINSSFIILAVIMTACSDDKKIEGEAVRTNSLYEDLKKIYRVYADSLAASEDSAKIDTIASNLDDKIRKIYQNYPPDLDYNISESQNDTLWRYVSHITTLRNRMRKPSFEDSIQMDSTSVLLEDSKE